MNHAWKDTDNPGTKQCHKCGCLRKRHTFRQLMAIVGNRDVYRYESKLVYGYPKDTQGWRTERPDCDPYAMQKMESEKVFTTKATVQMNEDDRQRLEEIIRSI